MLPATQESNAHSTLWWLEGEHNFKCLIINTVKQEMGSRNSSDKIGCVEPEGFQQLIADRFLQKGNPYLTISSFKWFQQTHEFSLVLMLLFFYTIKEKQKTKNKNMANVLIVSRADSFYKIT